MAQKNVAETGQSGNITTGGVKAVIDRAVNRVSLLLFILRKQSEHPSVLRTVLGDRKHFVNGIDSVLCDVSYDLDKLYERLYPESEASWDGPDLSSDLIEPMGKLNLALGSVFGRLDFPKEADDRALYGCVELMQDILNDLIEVSGELEVCHG